MFGARACPSRACVCGGRLPAGAALLLCPLRGGRACSLPRVSPLVQPALGDKRTCASLGCMWSSGLGCGGWRPRACPSGMCIRACHLDTGAGPSPVSGCPATCGAPPGLASHWLGKKGLCSRGTGERMRPWGSHLAETGGPPPGPAQVWPQLQVRAGLLCTSSRRF